LGGVAFWRILPLQTIADDVDDAAHHPPVIDTWHNIDEGKLWLQAVDLRLAHE